MQSKQKDGPSRCGTQDDAAGTSCADCAWEGSVDERCCVPKEKDIVACQIVNILAALQHDELRQDCNRLQIDRERPQHLPTQQVSRGVVVIARNTGLFKQHLALTALLTLQIVHGERLVPLRASF